MSGFGRHFHVTCPICNDAVSLELLFRPSSSSSVPIYGWYVKRHICIHPDSKTIKTKKRGGCLPEKPKITKENIDRLISEIFYFQNPDKKNTGKIIKYFFESIGFDVEKKK